MTPPVALWDDRQAFPSIESLPELRCVTHVQLHQAAAGDFQFLHEASLAWHGDTLYAAWANDPQDECSPQGACRGRRSADGRTWGPAATIAPSGEGHVCRNHGELVSDGQALHGFVARFRYGGPDIFTELVTERYTLSDAGWQGGGAVAADFWPFTKPLRTAAGHWVMLGVNHDTYPVAALSAGDCWDRWQVVPIPAPAGLIFVEPGLWVAGDRCRAVCRYQARSAQQPVTVGEVALVADSLDGGRSWTLAAPSNLPLAHSKVWCGHLSSGQRYLIGNLRNRDTLFLAVSRPGEELLCRAWRLRHGRSPEPRQAGRCKDPQWSYPSAVERDGELFVAYSVAKEDCALSIVPLAALTVD
ncbi:MAG: exo-alpha-sialidase [Fimbriimonadaceae bacterium]|nr:exo-alpha-sialidase [Fimbriimonadaceae bacterium]